MPLETPEIRPSPIEERSSSYLRLLLALLVSAAFFDGYDGSIVSLLLPDLQRSLHVPNGALGTLRVAGTLGGVAGFFLARMSDRFGRRPVLVWSVVGYTVFTALTALSPGFLWFLAFQLGAGVFIGAELGVSITIVTEEFPAASRGRALGILLAFNALGAIAVGGGLAANLQHGPLGWRVFYVVGLLPLVGLSILRRRIRETSRFLEMSARRAADTSGQRPSRWLPWQPPHRRNLIVVGVVHLLRTMPQAAATAFWAYYAEHSRGFSTGRVALFVIVANGAGTLGYWMCGRCMDRFGRRRTAVANLTLGLAFLIVLFQTTSTVIAFVALIGAVFFGLGASPVMGAFANELFPTEIRAQASAWVRNVFNAVGALSGPLLVSLLGVGANSPLGGIGNTVCLLAILCLPAIWLVWRYLPETRGIALD